MDVLAIGAHPDDCELLMGGTLAKLAERGYRVAVADLTRGECGSRGTPEMRSAEAAEAARILGLTKRIALDLGDSRIGLDPGHRLELVRLIRAERPTLIFSHGPDERHPDHRRACQLVREACFFANVAGFDTGQERFGPAALIEFVGGTLAAPPTPSFVVPINETIEKKMAAMRAYKSQFYNPEFEGPETRLSRKGFDQFIESVARFWGTLIGENYGEAFVMRGIPAIEDPVAHFREKAGKGI